MPVYMQVPVASLVEPDNPQRQETLLDRIDELRESIRANGLEQPIGVRDLGDGQYKIIYGHRRSIAVTQLQWSHIPAMVYQEGEGDTDVLMGIENYHRNNTNDAEEARYYARLLPGDPEGTIGIARRLNVPQQRIENLLLCHSGDESVFAALARGDITLHKAVEINKFKSPGYRAQALERCISAGLTVAMLRNWRKEIQATGIDAGSAEQQIQWSKPLQPTGSVPMDICNIGNHDVPLMERKVYAICNSHYNIFLEGLECLGKWRTIEEAGLGRELAKLLAIAEGRGTDVITGLGTSGTTNGS